MAETTARALTPTEERIGGFVIHYVARLNTWLYRLSGGRVFGTWLRGAPIGLLSYRGRRTGEWRTTPLLYLEDGDRVIVVGSKGGMSQHPWWYRNLQARPDCEFEIGSSKRAMRARTASDEERATLWPRLVAMYRDFADYQARTTRDIPVVILEPRSR
jgi:deazaflavin-dependent oxidoreductase (nitroreductase family)